MHSIDALPQLVHVVRRYGDVGGMETYVWKLTHRLAEVGVNVVVICEETSKVRASKIRVIELPRGKLRPRWKAMLRFRRLVDVTLSKEFQGESLIVHSHERTISHHVTTFHGPPMAPKGYFSSLWWLSPRLRAWEKMERHEITSKGVQKLLVVSELVRQQLCNKYPCLNTDIMHIAMPGVEPLQSTDTASASFEPSQKKFLFVGKEWKRKGLIKAVEIFSAYKSEFGNATLDVFGPDASGLSWLKKIDGVELKGWVSSVPWQEYDILIHPASCEPFGMVISEARREGVGVLLSELVGAASLPYRGVAVVPLELSVERWVRALHILLFSDYKRPEVLWTWDDLVDFHLDHVYSKVEVIPFVTGHCQ